MIDNRKLSISLLEYENEINNIESQDDKNQLELIKKTVFDMFRAVDEDDLGIVSRKECSEVHLNILFFINNLL